MMGPNLSVNVTTQSCALGWFPPAYGIPSARYRQC